MKEAACLQFLGGDVRKKITFARHMGRFNRTGSPFKTRSGKEFQGLPGTLEQVLPEGNRFSTLGALRSEIGRGQQDGRSEEGYKVRLTLAIT